MLKSLKEAVKANLLKLWITPEYDTPVEVSMSTTYKAISTLARCTDILINSSAKVNLEMYEDKGYITPYAEKPNSFYKLVQNPSSTMDTLEFYKQVYRDLIFKGSCLIYNTRLELQIIPTYSVTPYGYLIEGKTYGKDDFIFINLLSPSEGICGIPYMSRVAEELDIINYMIKFQKLYFRNNGIPGIILKTDRPLSDKLRRKKVDEFVAMTSIIQGRSGAPYILDDGMDVQELQHSFKDLQFVESLDSLETRIIQNLGIPRVLLNSGNNANISPNVKLFYYTVVEDFVRAVASAFTHHMQKTYRTKSQVLLPDFSSVPILSDDFSTKASSVQSLYVSGIITQNEARTTLKFTKNSNGGDEYLVPANIAGSNLNPSTGGKPSGGTNG